jgi:hypothetical protein
VGGGDIEDDNYCQWGEHQIRELVEAHHPPACHRDFIDSPPPLPSGEERKEEEGTRVDGMAHSQSRRHDDTTPPYRTRRTVKTMLHLNKHSDLLQLIDRCVRRTHIETLLLLVLVPGQS